VGARHFFREIRREKCRAPVTIVPEQPVIEAGPYRLIRHPSSTGLLIMFLGFGLSSTNWLSLLVLMGCALLGFSYRICVEERVLKAHLGLRYQEYMRRTKRLIQVIFENYCAPGLVERCCRAEAACCFAYLRSIACATSYACSK